MATKAAGVRPKVLGAQAFGEGRVAKLGSGMEGEEKVALVVKFMSARKAQDCETCGALLHPEVRYEGGRGEVKVGREAMLAYIAETAPRGTWSDPFWDPENQLVRAEGYAGYKMLCVSICSAFVVDDQGLIVSIKQGRKV